MSRPFLLGVLVILGVLLYLTSFALNKSTEPPPPPSVEEQQEARKKQEEHSKKERLEMMDRMKKAAKEKQAAQEKKKEAMNADTKLTPPGRMGEHSSGQPDPMTRSDRSIDIRDKWFVDRKPGLAGVKAERALREANNKKEKAMPAPSLVPAVGAGGVPTPPNMGAGAPAQKHDHSDPNHKH